MKTATFHLTSMAPYSQSRIHMTPSLEKEAKGDYEERTWIEKAHFNKHGQMFIPCMAFKQAVDDASKRLGKIPGQGNNTYTKHFVGGVIMPDDIILDVTRSDFEEDAKGLAGNPHIAKTQFSWGGMVNSDGKRGGGTRVFRRFPEVQSWEGDLTVMVLDEVVTKKVVTEAVQEAGALIGIGRFRPQNGGYYGRFKAELLSFE